MGVTGPMNIKEPGALFRKIVLRHFAAPVCHPNTLIELTNIFVAIKRSVKSICTVSESDSTHMDVTGPINFENN